MNDDIKYTSIFYPFETRLLAEQRQIELLSNGREFRVSLHDAGKLIIGSNSERELSDFEVEEAVKDKIQEGNIENVVEINGRLYAGTYDAVELVRQCDDLCPQAEFDRILEFFNAIDNGLIGAVDSSIGDNATFLPMLRSNIKEMESDGVSVNVKRTISGWLEGYMGLVAERLSFRITRRLQSKVAGAFETTTMKERQKNDDNGTIYLRDNFAPYLGKIKKLVIKGEDLTLFQTFKEDQKQPNIENFQKAVNLLKKRNSKKAVIEEVWKTKEDQPTGESSINYQYLFLSKFISLSEKGAL